MVPPLDSRMCLVMRVLRRMVRAWGGREGVKEEECNTTPAGVNMATASSMELGLVRGW